MDQWCVFVSKYTGMPHERCTGHYGENVALHLCLYRHDCLFHQSLPLWRYTDIAYVTKADADYIFDSLTVLLTWRFLVSYMLGYGKK